jgi:hypothetical protein
VDVNNLKFWQNIYWLGEIPPQDLTGPSPQTPQDHVFADFNGDGMTDVLITQFAPARSDLVQLSSSKVGAIMLMSSLNPNRQGATFRSPYPLTIKLIGINISRSHVGASGANLPYSADRTYSLDPAASAGITEPAPGESGFYIGYNPTTEIWQFFTHSDADWYQVALEIQSDGPIDQLHNDDIVDARPVLDSMLATWDDLTNSFVDATTGSGLEAGSACQSIVAEDFDNDTDLDLYMTCTGPIQNVANVLFENLGGGIFSPVPSAGGAEGTTQGRSNTVSSADYDMDGLVDIFVTNGMGTWPFHFGVNQLFRNTTANANHWLEIDLVGVESNRDGIGALVTLSAGGLQQKRTRSGGMHKYAQNYSRMHFGLGSAEIVDSITVNWPSGIETYITGVASDQIVTLIEIDAPEPTREVLVIVSIFTMLVLRSLRTTRTISKQTAVWATSRHWH